MQTNKWPLFCGLLAPCFAGLGVRWWQSLLVGVVVMSLSACAVTPQFTSQPAAQLSSAFGQFLAQAPPGSSMVLAKSSWGKQVTVYAHEAYPAASGRVCRKLTVVQAGMRRPGLVCRLPSGGWERVRVLARNGKPLLSPQLTRGESKESQQ